MITNHNFFWDSTYYQNTYLLFSLLPMYSRVTFQLLCNRFPSTFCWTFTVLYWNFLVLYWYLPGFFLYFLNTFPVLYGYLSSMFFVLLWYFNATSRLFPGTFWVVSLAFWLFSCNFLATLQVLSYNFANIFSTFSAIY